MCLRMGVYMYICVYVYVCVNVGVWICMSVHFCTCACVYEYVCMCSSLTAVDGLNLLYLSGVLKRWPNNNNDEFIINGIFFNTTTINPGGGMFTCLAGLFLWGAGCSSCRHQWLLSDSNPGPAGYKTNAPYTRYIIN